MFINIHTLPESHKGEKYFDLTNMMLGKGFGHIGLAETGIHWPLLPYEDKIPQIFRGHFMSQQLDYTTSYNQHDTLSGSYQYGGTLSLSAVNLIVITIKGGRYFSGLYRWSWQHFIGKVEGSLRIKTIYKPVPPATGVGAGLLYAEHLTHLHNIKILQCPIVAFIEYLGKET